MKKALSEAEKMEGSLDEIENTMISFGYEVWPWNQAYRKFLESVEARVGESFLLPKLQTRVAKRYEAFKQMGGTLGELHSGRPAAFFSLEERKNLREALVKLRIELKSLTDREVLSTEQKNYLHEVEHYQKVLKKIRNVLEELSAIADAESDYPALALEIRSQIRHFEFGLCLLGPEINHESVEKSVEFFVGRRHDLKHVGSYNIL